MNVCFGEEKFLLLQKTWFGDQGDKPRSHPQGRRDLALHVGPWGGKTPSPRRGEWELC